MTNTEALLSYRLKQAEEALSEAERMAREGFSPASIINRAYYSSFYLVLALFLKAGIAAKSSKHSGIISTFDKEFIKTGKIEKQCSKILHDLFDARQEADYKEFVNLTAADASELVTQTKFFFGKVKEHL